MYGFTRTKRVTDPLDEKVKARIIGQDRTTEPVYVSSGSEHSAHATDDDVTSPSLSDLLFNFDAVEDGEPSPDCDCSVSEHDSSMCERNLDLILPILMDRNEKDEFERVLRDDVVRAVQLFCGEKSVVRRNVMAYLRNRGYNAAVCKTKWDKCGGLTAGTYEFVDVLKTDSHSSERYFVDLDFAAEFEIARPTNSYERVLQLLPRVLVGKCEELKQILKAMSDAAKRSLKSRDLTLPPWRKHRFMQNKWLAPYRRTTNIFPASFSSPTTRVIPNYAVKCRAVGFDAAVSGGALLYPAAARTR